ncbi:MAG: hypothetical protein K0S26_1147 [Bacteroidota bacterium]|nr:hypothetical protein [Bacteroidota bacterium]
MRNSRRFLDIEIFNNIENGYELKKSQTESQQSLSGKNWFLNRLFISIFRKQLIYKTQGHFKIIYVNIGTLNVSKLPETRKNILCEIN